MIIMAMIAIIYSYLQTINTVNHKIFYFFVKPLISVLKVHAINHQKSNTNP